MTIKSSILYLIIALALLLTISNVYAQEQAFPVEIDSTTKFPAEGVAVTYEAKVQNPDLDDLKIEWDFGDGSTISGTGRDFLKIRHSFFLLDDLQAKYDIKLLVTDSKGTTVEATTWARPQVQDFRIIPIEPDTTIVEIEKGDSLELKIKVVDNKNSALLLTDLRSLIVSDGVQTLDFEKTSDPEVFKTTIETNEETISPFNFIKITASPIRSSKQATIEIALLVKPMEITLKQNPFGSQSFTAGNVLDTIIVEGMFENGNGASFTELNAFLDTSSGTIKLVPRKSDSGSVAWEIPMDYELTLKDITGGISLRLFGLDDFGNEINEQIALPVSIASDYLGLFILNPDLVLGTDLGYGQRAKFLVSLNSQKGEILEPIVIVSSTDLNINESLVFDSLANAFSGKVQIPGKNSGKTGATFLVMASANIEGTRVETREEIIVSFTDKLNVKFIYPQEGSIKFREDSGDLVEVNISYPDGAAIDKDSFSAIAFIDKKAYDVALEKNTSSNTFIGKLPFELEGDHQVRIKLKGLTAESAEIFTKIEKETGLIPIILVVLGVIIIAGGIYGIYTMMNNKKGEKLQQTPNAASMFKENKEKELERQYKQGKITTEDYAKQLLEIRKNKQYAKKEEKETKSESFKWDIERDINEQDREFLSTHGEHHNEDEQIKRDSEYELRKLEDNERVERLRKEQEEKRQNQAMQAAKHKPQNQPSQEQSPNSIFDRIYNKSNNNEPVQEAPKEPVRSFRQDEPTQKPSIQQYMQQNNEQPTQNQPSLQPRSPVAQQTPIPPQTPVNNKRASLLDDYLDSSKKENKKLDSDIEKKLGQWKKMFKE